MIQKTIQLTKRPFTRYLIVGGSAFIVEYSSFSLMYYGFHMWLIIANGLSFVFGLLTSFILNKLWTFGYKEYKKGTSYQFTNYTLLAVFNLIATLVLVSFLKHIGIAPKYGKLIAMVLTSTWNFLLFKYFIFDHKDTERAQP